MGKRARKESETPAVSPREAAYVAGLSEKTVQQAIDRHEIDAVAEGPGQGQPRSVSYDDLLYLRLRKSLEGLLTGEGKRKVREMMVRERPRPENAWTVSVGPVSVCVADELEEVNQRLSEVRGVRAMITQDAEVLAGEPVVAGTRIGVHHLAELARQGADESELLEDYPSLTPETLRAALTYARLYPRRGRPRSRWDRGTVLRRPR
jgi:uncharacterized protein (DUF433 family)